MGKAVLFLVPTLAALAVHAHVRGPVLHAAAGVRGGAPRGPPPRAVTALATPSPGALVEARNGAEGEARAPVGCPSINISGTPSSWQWTMGTFVMQPGNETGGRPAYYCEANKMWLYYFQPGRCWQINSDPHSGRCYFFSRDDAQTPDLISAEWYRNTGSSPRPLAPSVKASCEVAACTGSSTALPADQCAAWQAFWDGAGGDKGWTGYGAGCTRTDPCKTGCGDSRFTTCNLWNTTVTNMCAPAPARPPPPRSLCRAPR
jgi:hypothetical protein